MNPKELFKVSPGPHIRGSLTTGSVMYEVVLALIPAAIFGIGRCGAHALLVLLAAVGAAVLAEYAFCCFAGRDNPLPDGSAALTGLLLGLTLPGEVPLYIPFVGAVLAVAAKGLFGGLGRNPLNPAMLGRCLVTVIFRDQIAGRAAAAGMSASAMVKALIWHPAGLIGGSALALLLGGLFLLAVRTIRWHAPVAVLAGYALFSLLFGGASGPVLSQLGGGVMLAAFFAACDPVTTPVSDTGKLIFGGLVGLLTALLQRFTGVMEAACTAVLLADLVSPLIDRYTVPRPYTF